MANWQMVTLVGVDRPGIVAAATRALYEGGCYLGEAAMMRLGGNFSVMLMVRANGGAAASVEELVRPVADALDLRLHVDPIEGRLHDHIEPDVRVTVFGADRAGFVAQVTGALADAGVNILNLDSDVGGAQSAPLYVMHIEGQATEGIDAVRNALDAAAIDGIDARVTAIDTVLG